MKQLTATIAASATCCSALFATIDETKFYVSGYMGRKVTWFSDKGHRRICMLLASACPERLGRMPNTSYINKLPEQHAETQRLL
jgi:hypothetical protein